MSQFCRNTVPLRGHSTRECLEYLEKDMLRTFPRGVIEPCVKSAELTKFSRRDI